MRETKLAKLSELLLSAKDDTSKRTIIRLYGDYIRTLRTFQSRSERENDIIDDYHQVKKHYKMSDQTNEDIPINARQEANNSIIQALQPYLSANANKVNLNELVVRPDTFNGYQPRPREWIEMYEEAFMANEWSEITARKYFPTFLRETALDWYQVMVRPKLDTIDSWEALKRTFTRHYLGKDELRVRRQELSAIVQGPREPSTSFIPKVYKMIRQLHPRIEEDEAVDKIVTKLRAEIIKSLPLDSVETVEELVALACKIEGRERQIEQRNKRSNGWQPRNAASRGRKGTQESESKEERDKKPEDESDRKSEEGTERSSGEENRNVSTSRRSSVKCYRCDRLGHVGKYCRSTTTISGDPVRLPRTETTKVNAVEEPRLGLNAEVVFEDRIHSISTIQAPNNRGKRVSKKMLFQKLRCNGLEVMGLVDTGSFHTIIDESIVREQGWKVDGPAPVLGAAGNNPLHCIGTCELEIELAINKRIRCAKIHVAVVANLGLNLLIGLEFVSIFRLIIDAEYRQIYFKKASLPTTRETGIRNKEKLILEPRTQSVVAAEVPSIGTILTVPITLGNGALIANSVSESTKGEVNVIILNPTNKTININAKTQLASFELLSEPSSNPSVNRVIELTEFDEPVNVGDELENDKLQQLSELLVRNKEAFAWGGKIGEFSDPKYFHKIELLPDAKPFNEQLRRRPQIHVEETRRQVQKMLEEGIIEESDSPWSSAYLLVRKKSGEYRLCIDFRRLNNLTKKFVYPLPNIEDCIDTLSGNKFFSLLDFSSGFHQLPLDKNSRELTAFKTEDGLFHYTRMPFGLANAPASFQKMVNAMLMGLRGVNLQIFIDDICIASKSWQDHIIMLSKVLEVVIKSKLKLKGSKCVFGAKKVLFLGHIISAEGVKQDPAKTSALLEMPRPTDVSGVRRVLGMLGYYRRFIENFAAISEPLTRLLKKNAVFRWQDEEERAFRALLTELAKDATLGHFNHTDPIMVKTDASKQGVAAILLQKQQEEWRLICCCSRRLNEHEQNYGISELEALAIIYAVNKLRSFLLGKHFQVLTDHSALTVLNEKNPASARLRRWALILQEFDFTIVYTKGQLQADVDCFSRAPVDPPDENIERRIFHVALPRDACDWSQAYCDEQSQKYLKAATEGRDEFQLRNGIIYFKNCLYVPPSKRNQIIEETHISMVSCHGGIAATLNRLAPYWWPTKTDDVKAHVTSCQACQARKTDRAKPAGTMHSFEIFGANEMVAIDIMGPITETVNRNRHVIVAIDCFTRFVFAKALADTGSNNFVNFLLEYVSVFGIPRRILTDNAKSFNSKQTKEVERILGLTHIFSTPTHSQGNAIAERVLQSLQDKLNLVLKQQKLTEDHWDAILPIAVLSLNTSHHKSLGYSPYEMRFGNAHPIAAQSTQTSARSFADVHVELLRTQLEELRANGVSAQSDAQSASKERYDQSHRQVSFAPGELVEVKAKSRSSKLADRYDRIAKIISKTGDIYKLSDIKTGAKFDRHISKLKRHYPVSDQVHLIQTISIRRDQVMRANRSRRFESVVWALAIAASTVAHVTSGQASETPRTGFVQWKEQKINVLESKREFEIKVLFTDPCPAIHEQFPSFYSPSSEEYNPIYYAYYGCSDLYRRSITNTMDELVERFNMRTRRSRRAIPLLGLIGGIWLSNVIDSVFNDNDEIADQESKQNELLEALNRRQNYSTEAIVELAQNQKFLVDKVNQLYTLTNNYARDLIRLQFALQLVTTHINMKKAAIDEIRFGLINGKRLDLHALNNLLDTKQFENVDSESLEFISVEKFSKNGYVFRFFGHIIEENMRIYTVQAMTHWVNVTESPSTLMSYSGPPMVLVNLTNRCVVGISDTRTDTISQGCYKHGGRSGDLDMWIPIRTGNPFHEPARTTTIESMPTISIYCFGRTIEIEEEPPIDCPPYAFMVNAVSKWRTSDRIFSGYAKSSFNFIVTEQLPEYLIPSKIQEPSNQTFSETETLKRLYNLTALLEAEKLKSFVLNTPVGGVSYAIWNKILLCTIGCSVCIIIWGWRHSHQAIQKSHNKVIRTIRSHLESTPRPIYPKLTEQIGELEQKKESILSFISGQKGENELAQTSSNDSQ